MQRAEIPIQAALPFDVRADDPAGLVHGFRRQQVARAVLRRAHEHAAGREGVGHGPRAGMAPTDHGD